MLKSKFPHSSLFVRCSACLIVAFCVVGEATYNSAVAQRQSAATSQLSVAKVKKPEGWMVVQGDRLFAGYQIDSNGKPIIYPLVGPGGHRLTRDFPMKDAGPNERDDHDHHRYLLNQ